jgi:hypothetical protein
MDAGDIAAHVLGDLEYNPTRQSDEDRAQSIALLIASEYPDAPEDVVRAALQIVNEKIRGGFLRSAEPLRPIEPVGLTGLDIGDPEHGEPICERVDPRELFVDPSYQRSIGERGARQIRQIIENFDWNRFKPPIAAYAEHDGKTVLMVLDGQHTAIACASHPKIGLIPVMIVEAAETAAQASSFVGQNTGRLAVTPLQLHKSALVAEDPDAVTVANVCGRAGVKILATSPKKFAPGETVAIAAISSLVDRRGAMKARIILEVLAQGGFAPISAPQNLKEAVATGWPSDYEEAKTLAVAHRWPLWKAIAINWFRKTPKKRKPQGRAA